MGISKLILQNFRNYQKREFSFGEKTVIVGNNGVGKTNIIEAIYLLTTGKSFRADYDSEMVNYDADFFRVTGEISQIGQIGQISLIMNEGKKRFEVNEVSRRQIDFVGQIRAVLFAPQDMEIISGSPSVRRRYLDFVISQVDREYRRCLISYEKGLRSRNKLLDAIREGRANRTQLYFWDHLLVKNGTYITEKRAEFLGMALCEYDKSIISPERLKQYEVEEVMAATTLVGPHRDDFVVLREGRDVSKYGSRGEQRMMVWWLKQCEINYLGGEPILLLDDIFSELDHAHRVEVADYVRNYPGQVIATEADEHLLPEGVDWQTIKI